MGRVLNTRCPECNSKGLDKVPIGSSGYNWECPNCGATFRASFEHRVSASRWVGAAIWFYIMGPVALVVVVLIVIAASCR